MQGNEIKTASLLYVMALIALIIAPIPTDSIALGGAWYTHFTYQHFHANIFHLTLNIWAFLSFVFLCNMKWWQLITAFVISATYPIELIGGTPVIGLSGVVFAIVGIYSLYPTTASARIKYNTFAIFSILLGLLLPRVAFAIHLYCYAAGLVVALFTHPLITKK